MILLISYSSTTRVIPSHLTKTRTAYNNLKSLLLNPIVINSTLFTIYRQYSLNQLILLIVIMVLYGMICNLEIYEISNYGEFSFNLLNKI